MRQPEVLILEHASSKKRLKTVNAKIECQG